MNMMDLVGRALGNYRIEAPLDAGGMGQVFRGVHIYLDRPAAIKVMRGSFAANPKFRARFLQEAKSAAALKHPNIVDIYEFGDQDGLLYLVMELMTGGSLRTLLHRRTSGQPWSLSLGLDLMRQAAEGLAAAHALTVVHRDIKPDNLMLNRLTKPGQEREQYQLKISDFGLARLAAGSGLTATGATMGTLAYMSPEQCQGGKLDGRSDLYSLGIVLYEVVTGSQPFQIDNFDDAFNKHVNIPPPPPRQLRPDLPTFIEEIILRCLAKKPDERYATGTELAQALQRAMGDARLLTVAPLRLPPVPPGLMKSTVLQSSGGGGVPPPVVSTLLRPSKLPQVCVLDLGGKTLQVIEVTSRGLTIGRQPGNDIILDAQGVSRQHLRVQWDGKQVSVKDLGSSNGTWLGGQRLQHQVSQVWTERQVVRLGPFWLRLEAPNPAALASMPGGLSQTIGYDAAMTRQMQGTAAIWGSGRIGVLVEPGMLTITPGEPTTVKATLVNQGSIVDWLTITVEGVAPGWMRGPSQEVKLNPGMQETVELSVNVARTASNLANDYPVTIRARSREKPDESGTARALWTVLPFTEDTLRIEPRRASGRGSAAYTIALQNGGNTPTRHELKGEDDEQKIEYGFGANPVALEPGKEVRVPLTVKLRRHWIGREQRQPFQIHARPTGSSIPLTTTGEFVNKAILPGWVMPMVGVVLAASIVLGALLSTLHTSPSSKVKAMSTQTVGTTITPTVGTTVSPTAGTTISPTVGMTATPTVGTTVTTTPTQPPGTFAGEYPISTANSGPLNITLGPDKNFWFTESNANQIGRITTNGTFAGEYPISTVDSGPGSIKLGPDNNLWFTEERGNKIGRITTSGSISEFAVPTANSVPDDITSGPDGNLWFTEKDGNKIGRITTSGSINEFLVSTANSAPFGITLGPDNNLWFTECNTNQIGRITPSGSIDEFPISPANSCPDSILSGPDGNLWFTEERGNKIGRITTSGAITGEFVVPTADSLPNAITLGPDKNLWFTETKANQIGSIAPSGTFAGEYQIPTANSSPGGITSGPDGNLWFAEHDTNKIGRITSL